MASPARPAPASPARPADPGAKSDWTVQAADTIESVVGSIRDKTAVPLETIARAVVYGLLAGVMGVTALILVAVVLVRVLDIWLPTWAAHGIWGALFTLIGLFLWSKRKPAEK